MKYKNIDLPSTTTITLMVLAHHLKEKEKEMRQKQIELRRNQLVNTYWRTVYSCINDVGLNDTIEFLERTKEILIFENYIRHDITTSNFGFTVKDFK